MSGVKTQYDPVARLLHIVMALIMIGMLALGLYMADLAPSPDKWKFYGIHKSIGMIALFLIGLRILWRGIHQPPAPLTTQQWWEIKLAKLVHILLYIGMIVMPVSGYVMSAAGGHPISVFGWFDVPLIIAENKELGGFARQMHEYAAYALIGAIALHFAGAMKHHFIDRDKTLSRMFWGRC